jgi:two-component system sensor histidine kinase BaeS
LVGLLATMLLVAVGSSVATTLLTVRNTSEALHTQESQNVAATTHVYRELVGYAATHHSWSGVGPLVTDLAKQSGRRLVLTTSDHKPIADSAPVSGALPATPSALVDPLRTDHTIGDATGDIDPRAVGPYALDQRAHDELAAMAAKTAGCMTKLGYPAKAAAQPDGRPTVVLSDPSTKASEVMEMVCGTAFDVPTAAERAALDALDSLVANCLAAWSEPPVSVQLEFRWTGAGSRQSPHAQECVDASRRQQLLPYVAPPAVLYILDPAAATPLSTELSTAALVRIFGVAALVLVAAAAMIVLLVVRLVRPLRRLTEAVRQPADRHVRVPVSSRDEIGVLAEAFNDLSLRRERAEAQRVAMVNDIAHELRTPLTTIRGWLEAAEDGLATPDSDPELMSALLREALSLQRIVDDLRDLAEADAGMLRIHPEPIVAADLLADVATAHRALADQAGVRLVVDPAAGGSLLADPVRMRQMVANLVTNAIRHTPAGGQVALRARPDGDQVRIQVADTGSGLGDAERDRVFDRFWRAERSRSRRSGGSGLGLAIVRQLVKAHGGSVGVDSEPGRGAVFTLLLPASPAVPRH